MQANNEKITPELLRRSQLVFYPRTAEETIFIQQRLLDMGAVWADGVAKVSHVADSVNTGLIVQQGKILYNPGKDPAYRLATIEQFDGEYLTPEQKFLKEQFDKVHARLDEMDRKIGELQAALLPRDIGKLPKDVAGKPALKRPRP